VFIIAHDNVTAISGQHDLEQSVIELKSQVDDLNKNM
jgi:hypothetical protein